MINTTEFLPNWTRDVNITGGIRYVDPKNSSRFFRIMQSGNAPGRFWHRKPYYRKADGFYPDGTKKWLDTNGNPSTDADLTHFVIDVIEKIPD